MSKEAEQPSGLDRRPRLSREDVLRAAVDFADHDGITGLSMRKLAERLGVEAMSLYHHVANKAAILDGMVDVVFSEMELPAVDSGWREAMEDRAASARRVLLQHPWALGLMESRRNPGAATLRHHDAVIGCLRRAGFTIGGAAHAFSLIDSYVYGFLLQELNLPFSGEPDLSEMGESMLGGMPVDEFPYLTEMITQHAMRPGYAFADEFGIGLVIVLDGVEGILRATPDPSADQRGGAPVGQRS